VTFVGLARACYPGILLAAVPNGGYRRAKEGKRLKAEGVLAGYPDVLVDEPRGVYHGLRVEMKRRSGGALSDSQREVHRALRRRGFKVVTCRGHEEAMKELDLYMALPRQRPDPTW
jgi:hypothetical protein